MICGTGMVPNFHTWAPVLDAGSMRANLTSPSHGCGLVTTVLAVRKRDLQVGLMYASNRLHSTSGSKNFQIGMKDIPSQHTHRQQRARGERIPTFTFGELSFGPERDMYNQRTGNGPWQMRVVCGTFDQSLYTPDREAMRTFYRSIGSHYY